MEFTNNFINNGYIKVYRDMRLWEWYKHPYISRLFMHFLLCANHKDNKWQGKTIKAGSFITSRQKLAQELNLSEQKIRTGINKLKSTNEITSSTNGQYTVITINNWNLYQTNNQVFNQQITTNNNVKNDNNVENVNNSFLHEEKEKIINIFCNSYEEVFNKKCYLSDKEKKELITIIKQNPEVKEEIALLLLKYSKIRFTKGHKSLSWLLLKGNWAGVLNGEYDQFIDGGAKSKIEQKWTL